MNKNPGEGLRMVWSTVTILVPIVGVIMSNWHVVFGGLSLIVATAIGYWLIEVQRNADTDYRVKLEDYLSGCTECKAKPGDYHYRRCSKRGDGLCVCDNWKCNKKHV